MSNFHLATKVLNYIDTRPKENEVKGAVKLDPELNLILQESTQSPGTPSTAAPVNNNIYATFDKEGSLDEFIAQISGPLGLENSSENYALMFEDRKRFVTEHNKQSVPQGFFLTLTASPTNFARHFVGALRRDPSAADLCAPLPAPQLSLVASLCADPAFVDALAAHQGIARLAEFIGKTTEWRPFCDSNNASSLFLLMRSLLTLLQQHADRVPWADLLPDFVHKIAHFINGQSKVEQNESRDFALTTFLAIAEHCEHLHECLKEHVKVEALIRHLDNTDERILISSLTLINVLYGLADRAECLAIVKILHERPFIAAIGRVLEKTRRSHQHHSSPTSTSNYLSPSSSSSSSDQRSIAEQLKRLQQIRFDEVRALALRIPSDREIGYALSGFAGGTLPNELDDAGSGGQNADLAEFRQLVRSTPPGSLAICTLLDLTRPPTPQQDDHHLPPFSSNLCQSELHQNFVRLGRPHLWSLVLAKLVDLLINVLGIGALISSVGLNHRRLPFWRVVLTSDRPFPVLFHVLVDLFQRTWAEMHANPDDMAKVTNVVREQFERAMAEDPQSVDHLEQELLRKKFSYFGMQKLWRREQTEQEELELTGPHIKPLRDYLRPQFEQLVLRRCINFLKRGTTLQRLPTAISSSSAVSTTTTTSATLLFWRLDDRQKQFHFWECRSTDDDGKHPELALNTQRKLAVSQIRNVLHGDELHSRQQLHHHQQYGMKGSKKGQALSRCSICLVLNPSSSSAAVTDPSSADADEFWLCSDNETEMALWLDGLKCLRWPQQALEDAAIRQEIDRLLGLELHIRLMDQDQQQSDHSGQLLVPPEPPTDLSWIPTDKRAMMAR